MSRFVGLDMDMSISICPYPIVFLCFLHNTFLYYVRTELPEVKSEELDIQATANNLAISGEMIAVEEEGAKYHRREREARSFSRLIGLPGEVDTNTVDARLKIGVYTCCRYI